MMPRLVPCRLLQTYEPRKADKYGDRKTDRSAGGGTRTHTGFAGTDEKADKYGEKRGLLPGLCMSPWCPGGIT